MLRTVTEGTGFTWLSTPAMHHRENATGVSVKQTQDLYHPETSVPHGLLSSQDYRIGSIVIECGLIPFMVLLGIPANIVNMVVFYRQGLRDKMNLCLFALAFVDFMYVFLVFLSVFYCPAVLFPDSVLVQILKWKTLRLSLSFRKAFLYISGVLTAIIATERCICVVWPLRSATMLKTKTIAWMILGIIVVMNLLCLPYALKHVVRVITDESGNVTVIYDDTDLYNNNKLAFLIVRDGVLSMISFATFLIVSFVTVVSVRKLKIAMDWRQKTSSNVMDKRQLTLVKILITVSCVYIVCNIPLMSLAMVKFVVDEFSTLGRYRKLFFITHRTGTGLLMVNSSANIFIYYTQSSKFRRELQACICCLKNPTAKT